MTILRLSLSVKSVFYEAGENLFLISLPGLYIFFQRYIKVMGISFRLTKEIKKKYI